MRTIRRLTIASFVLALCVGATNAGTVTVKGAHICCGACASGVKKALKDVDGVSKASAEKTGGTISFEAKKTVEESSK